MRRLKLLWAAAILFPLGAGLSPIAAGLAVGVTSYGPKLWTENGLVVPVCFRWTNAVSSAYAMQRQWIREAVENTWGKHTALHWES